MSKEKHTGAGAWLKNYLAEREAAKVDAPKRMQRHPHALDEPEPKMSLDSSMDLLYQDPEDWNEQDDIEPTCHGPEFDFD